MVEESTRAWKEGKINNNAVVEPYGSDDCLARRVSAANKGPQFPEEPDYGIANCGQAEETNVARFAVKAGSVERVSATTKVAVMSTHSQYLPYAIFGAAGPHLATLPTAPLLEAYIRQYRCVNDKTGDVVGCG